MSLLLFVVKERGCTGDHYDTLVEEGADAWDSAEVVDVDGDSGVRPLLTSMAPRSIDVSHRLCGLDGAGGRGRRQALVEGCLHWSHMSWRRNGRDESQGQEQGEQEQKWK